MRQTTCAYSPRESKSITCSTYIQSSSFALWLSTIHHTLSLIVHFALQLCWLSPVLSACWAHPGNFHIALHSLHHWPPGVVCRLHKCEGRRDIWSSRIFPTSFSSICSYNHPYHQFFSVFPSWLVSIVVLRETQSHDQIWVGLETYHLPLVSACTLAHPACSIEEL